MSQDLRTVRLSSVGDLPPDFQVHTDRGGIFRKLKPPILDLYIFLEILSPFLVALSFFTMIFMAVAIQKMIGLLIGKGVDFFRLLDYLGYILGNTLPMTIPMACLMSGIMAAGRLSGDSEITAMRSAGISFPRIYYNFLFFGFIMACTVGYLNFYLAPENTRKMKEFNNWIMTYNPLLAISPGQFSGDDTQDFMEKKGRTMYSGGFDEDTGVISGVQIREWEIYPGGNDFISLNDIMIPMGGSRVVQIINAKSGILVEKKNPDGEFEKAIRLREGFIVEWDEQKQGFTVTNFINGEMDYNVPKKEETVTLQINVKPETFSMPDLFTIRDSIESDGLENIPGLEILKDYGLSIKGVGGLRQMVEKMKMDILIASTSNTKSTADLTREVTLFTQMNELLTESKKTLTSFNVEIHRRIATPVSCQIFFFLSFPLGLVVKRSGKGMSFTLAVVFLLVYYLFYIFGSGISYREGVPDWIGPWSANFVIAIISVYIMVTRTDAKFPEPIQKVFDRFSETKEKITYIVVDSLTKIKRMFRKGDSQ